MKKWLLLLLSLSLLLCLAGCGNRGEDTIVEDLEGPEGIDLFAGLWYYEDRDLWIEIYYDGDWCSFEDGGMLRSFGSMTVEDQEGILEPTEGEDRFVLTAAEGKLTDSNGRILFKVTEVGVRKPLIVNDLGVPDTISFETEIEGEVDAAMVKEYAGFYISEDGIFALELFEDGSYELQEYGLLVEKGKILRLSKPYEGQVYAVDPDMKEYRLVITREERIWLGGSGIFAPGEKSVGFDE